MHGDTTRAPTVLDAPVRQRQRNAPSKRRQGSWQAALPPALQRNAPPCSPAARLRALIFDPVLIISRYLSQSLT
jgi:hypothetical protein